ncbi:MAG: NADPH:quinone reductase-like Zn-dependent oxidoreductase [Mariniblastus sp.]|jgi:NADPH:quinone reductase-like Zn-dependent oxidoreductase
MKAIVWTKYGPPEVLVLRDIAKPQPKDSEIRIKIHATTAFPGDCETRALKFPKVFQLLFRLLFGLFKPRGTKILGQELAGEIESVGKSVTRFKLGDKVFGNTGLHFGAYAQYVCLHEKADIALIPIGISYAQAAALPTGGMNALHFVRLGKIQRGEKVLINGAGGSIGTTAIQLIKALEAEVTVVDSTGKLDTLLSLGADKAIDYTQQNFNDNGERYDVIFDVVGKSNHQTCIKQLNPGGRYLLANSILNQTAKAKRACKHTDKQVISTAAQHNSEDLVYLAGLVEAGKLSVVIDSSYPLEQVVEAHLYVDSAVKTGQVVLTVSH